MIQKKSAREPLGSRQNIEKILSHVKQEDVQQQTKNITIIYAKSKLQVDIPVSWSVNKIKSMLIIHFQMLNFDKFQFQCNKYLIPGKTLVSNLPGTQLIVTQAQCPKSFQTYYKQQMKKIVKKYQISTENSLYPTTHRSFTYVMGLNIPKGRADNLQQLPANRGRRQNNEQQGPRVLNILRFFGLFILINIIYHLASLSQIAVLIAVCLIYFLMDQYIKQNNRRRVQRQRQQRQAQELQRQAARQQKYKIQQRVEQQRPQFINKKEQKQENRNLNKNQENNEREQEVYSFQRKNQLRQNIHQDDQQMEHQICQEQKLRLNQNQSQGQAEESLQQIKAERQTIKAKLILWTALIAQTFYCFTLSIFPNWTIQTHLHANEEKMDKILDQVKELDPEASEMIKNWKKQNNKGQADNKTKKQ